MVNKEKNAKIDALRVLANYDPADDIIGEVIPTGYPELDYLISRGLYQDEHGKDLQYDDEKPTYGIPTGKLVQFFGNEGCGKSSLAYKLAGNAQRMGKLVFWIDAENSFSKQLAKINGLDLETLTIQKVWDKDDPEKIFDAETIIDRMQDACKAGAGVVVLDSVGAIVPRYVMENPADKDTMAALARVLGKTLGKLAGYAAANNTLVVFINQLQMNPGVMFGSPEGTKGGKTLAHMVSLTLKMTKLTAEKWLLFTDNEKGEEELIAGSASVQIVKNRFASPVRESVYIPIYYKYYFPNAEEIVFDYGRKTKTISVRSGVFSWGKIKAPGKANFIEELKKQNVFKELVEGIKKNAESNKIPLPTEVLNYDHHAHFAATNEVYQKGEEASGNGVESSKKFVNKSKKSKDKIAVTTVLVDETPEL